MVLIMDEFDKPCVNTLEEVKKLQDLVRKLEIQNQQLRNKQNKSLKKSSVSDVKEFSRHSSSQISDGDEFTSIMSNNNNNDCFKVPLLPSDDCHNDSVNYFDQLDLIRVNDADISDDDSWLFTSPKGLTPEQKSESSYKWLRKDVDDPDNKELQLAKKALITKLNDLEILSPTSQAMKPQPLGKQMHGGFSKPYKVSPTIHDHPQNSLLDTRTFTKSKKKQALEFLASTLIVETSERHETHLHRRGSDVSLDSLSSGTYMMADASDVQEVARLQEESLRMSSPVGTPKRHLVTSNHSSRRMSVSSRSSISDADNPEHVTSNSYINSDVATPTSIPLEAYNHSDHSSPSGSPYGSNVSLNNIGSEKGDVYRRSLPNLNRDAGVKPRVLRNVTPNNKKQQKSFVSQSSVAGRRSDSNLLASASKSRRNVMSPTQQKLKPPSSYVSPSSSNSSLPCNQGKNGSPSTPCRPEAVPRLQARSGLPKPMRTASATRLGSGIPVTSVPNKKSVAEETWSEGCF